MTTEQRLTEFAEAVAADIKSLNTKLNTFTYDQMVPSLVWGIDHMLGKYPSVEVVDSAGTVVTGSVQYINTNRIEISFAYAFSGKAYLN